MENIDKNNDISTFSATMRSIRISDKKVKPLIRAIKGKNIELIISTLSVQRLKASNLILKLIRSAISNVPKSQRILKNVSIKKLCVDQGRSYKRILTRSQGRVNYIYKKTSHITVIISLKNHT